MKNHVIKASACFNTWYCHCNDKTKYVSELITTSHPGGNKDDVKKELSTGIDTDIA